jgi:oxygen-dependent protoporphyrinogen oxidase
MTVMLGGPYYTPSQIYVPTVLGAVASHLGTAPSEFPEPLAYTLNVQKNCIPTYKPGHLDRMGELDQALEARPWGGKLAVIGAGVRGVSMGDCVEAGRSVGKNWETS